MPVVSTIQLNGCNFQFCYDLISQSATNNTSTISIYGILNVTNNYVAWSSGRAWTHTASANLATYYSRGSYVVTQGNFTFTHDSNGDLTLTAGYGVETTFTSGSGTATWSLPHIDRFAIMLDATNFNDEGNPSFTYNNPRNLTLTAWLEINPVGEHLAERTITNAGSSGTYTWVLTNEERNQLRAKIPQNNSAICRIGIISTIGGTSSASYKDKTFSIVNANPTFNNYDIEDVNTITKNLTGSTLNNVVNVNGYSNIKATISTLNKAEAIKQASMVKYRLLIGDASVDINYSDESSVNGTLNNVTTGTYNLYAIDSRNNSTLVTKQATSVINYEKITLDKQNCSFVRDDNQVGENAILTINGTFWNDDFGAVTNSIKSVTYKLKKTDSSTWITGTTTITPTTSGNSFTFTGMIASDNLDTTWDLDASYNLELTISDELSSATIDNLVLNSAVPTLSLDKNGVGVMCAFDSQLGGYLQVNGEIVKTGIGELLWEGSFSTGSLQVDGISKYTMIGIKSSGLLMVGNQNYGGMVFTTYQQMSHSTFAYRFTYNKNTETLSTTTDDRGATDGVNQLTITQIYGIF